MIYQVNKINEMPEFYVDETTYLNNKDEFTLGTLVIGTQQDAENKLAENRVNVLSQEENRFSICATFINGNDTTWRAVLPEDDENTICQVFNYSTGMYTETNNKTEAYSINENIKQQFIVDLQMDSVISLDNLPT